MKYLPKDIYRQCSTIAKSYYLMLQRRKELTEEILHGSYLLCNEHGNKIGDPTARTAERLVVLQSRNDQKIKAVEEALDKMPDLTAKAFIRKNVFEGIQMHYINLPLSLRTMKRLRREFIVYLAISLGEV